jgi:hypothetical protein
LFLIVNSSIDNGRASIFSDITLAVLAGNIHPSFSKKRTSNKSIMKHESILNKTENLNY